MRINDGMLRRTANFGVFLMMGISMSAKAGLFGLVGTSWKEEVLLHDGSKIVVARSVERGGRHEIGQKPPIKEQSLSFIVPVINRIITWEDRRSEDLGSANFLPMLLDIFKDVPYLVAYPMGCLSYNKWGRPNPPYVIFKYDKKEWKRIPLQELPTELKMPNLIFSSPDTEAEKLKVSLITSEMIRKLIGSYKQPEHRSILRVAVKGGEGLTSCPDYNSQQYRSSKAPLPMKPATDK